MNEFTLFRYEDRDIRITIEARWEGEVLVVEGYDIGKRVEEYWGDSNYEYSAHVPAQEAKKLFALLGVNHADKAGLLHRLAERFCTNTAYSEFRHFLNQHGVCHEGFSWT